MARGYFVRLNPAGDHMVAIVQELKRLKVPFAVIGGVAMGAYREARTTRDVDLIVPAGEVGRLANHLASLVPGAWVQRFSFSRGQSFYRIKVGRGKKEREVADVAPSDLYPQYASAHASGRPTVVTDYEGFGRIPVAGREEMIALKILSSLSPHRRLEKRFQDETDIVYLLDGADLAKARSLVSDIPGGVEALARMVFVRDSRQGKKKQNPQARAFGPAKVRCWTCGRPVPLVRGGRFKAHDFDRRRCAGSGGIA